MKIQDILYKHQDEKPYTKRAAMLLLKKFYLEEYYVNMMIAWLFADALVFQWDCVV